MLTLFKPDTVLFINESTLSPRTPESDAPVLNVNLADSPGKIQVDQCLWSKAEEVSLPSRPVTLLNYE